MLRSRLNSRSYHLLKTCQTCTTSCLPETLCRPALLIMSSQQHCKTGSCDQQIHISLAKRMPEWREGEDSRIWSCSQGSCSHQEWLTSGIPSISLTKESHGHLMVCSGAAGFYFRSFWPRTLPSHYLLEFDALTSYRKPPPEGAFPFNPASIFKHALVCSAHSLLWLMGSIPCTAGESSRS